jgi:hypothetical protein
MLVLCQEGQVTFLQVVWKLRHFEWTTYDQIFLVGQVYLGVRVCAGPQLTLPVDSIFTFVYSFSTNGTYDNLNEPK